MGLSVDAAARPGSSGADSARGAGAGPGRLGCCGPTGLCGPPTRSGAGTRPISRAPAGWRSRIVDVVSRRWIDTLVSIEETSTQVRVIFDSALAAEGLTELITPERVELFEQDPTQPILLACSDNGPQMTSKATREFFAALAVAQRLGRPRTPTDQAWIESPLRARQSREPPPRSDPRPGRPRNRAATRPPRLQHHPPPRRHRIRHPQRRAHRPRRTDPPRAHRGPEASPPTAPRLPSPKPPPQQPPRAGMSWSIPQPLSAFYSETGQVSLD